MGKKTSPLKMNAQQRDQLEAWVRAKTSPQRLVFRAQICLLAADGLSATAVAQKMNTTRPTVLLWKTRFEEQGPEALTRDAPRGPSPRRLAAAMTEAIVHTTLNSAPPDGSHWTTRALAKVLGVSNATVARVWKARGIRPPKKKGSKRAKEKPAGHRFAELAGVYVNPPVKALVVLVGQPASGHCWGIEALGFPLETPGRERWIPSGECGWSSGLPTVFALLESRAGHGVGSGDRSSELVRFLRSVDRQIPKALDLHVILDDAGLGVYPDAVRWADKRARVSLHVHPLGSPRKSPIEEVVQRLTGAPLSAADSNGVSELVSAVDQFTRIWHGNSKPFVWTRKLSPGHERPAMCKVMLETIRRLGALVAALVPLHPSRHQLIRTHEEVPMKWKEWLENIFAAAAFAEEGEHQTALRIANCPVPESKRAAKILSFLATTFAAAAFAEESCHEIASEILYGARGRASFLEEMGLRGVRVWYGTAPYEQSFAEAVGLVGVRLKLVTVRL
jgi:transposase